MAQSFIANEPSQWSPDELMTATQEKQNLNRQFLKTIVDQFSNHNKCSHFSPFMEEYLVYRDRLSNGEMAPDEAFQFSPALALYIPEFDPTDEAEADATKDTVEQVQVVKEVPAEDQEMVTLGKPPVGEIQFESKVGFSVGRVSQFLKDNAGRRKVKARRTRRGSTSIVDAKKVGDVTEGIQNYTFNSPVRGE